MSDDALQRGRRWSAFYEEEGGLRDMIAALGTVYIERMSTVEPWETDKLSKLAMANKITKQLDGFILEVIGTGNVAAAAKRHREQIEALPARKRRLLGFGTE
jgi:hypothetical protein